LPVRQFSKLVVSATHPSHLLIFPLTELWDGKDRFSKRTLQIDAIFFYKITSLSHAKLNIFCRFSRLLFILLPL
ncbi:MAG: hypothetical protein KAX69_04925, partial [Chitinophagales bacterium]|nr:hypothetical protein [Chitinophagales bacterium]